MTQRIGIVVHKLGKGLQVDQRGQLINLIDEREDPKVLVLEHGLPALVGCEVLALWHC
jgi:hypothetical protein